MTSYDPEEAKRDFEQEFGQITVSQAWILTKFAKHVRGRCRNNNAFNNYISKCFPHLKFGTVPRTDKQTGRSYDGLEITEK